MPFAVSDFGARNCLASAIRRAAYESSPTAVALATPPPAVTKLPDITSSPAALSTAFGLAREERLVDRQAVGSSTSASTAIWSPGASSKTSSITRLSLATSRRLPSRQTATVGAPTNERRSSVVLARHSWNTPITTLSTITTPNRASRHSPRAITTAISAAITALNRVSTFALTISPSERDERLAVRLTLPSATRFATSSAPRPLHGGTTTSLTGANLLCWTAHRRGWIGGGNGAKVPDATSPTPLPKGQRLVLGGWYGA